MISDPIPYNGFDIRTYSFAIDESGNFFAAYNISTKVGSNVDDEGLFYLRVDGVNCEYSSESEAIEVAFNAAVQVIDERNK